MSRLHELTAGAGDRQATDALFRLVYDDLKQLAERYLRGERPGHTLQPTALVHEAYVRLLGPVSGAGPGGLPWSSRASFYAAAARAMRHILVESARRKLTAKRGGGLAREVLDPERIAEPEVAGDLLALHEALERFAAVEPGIAELVSLRFFGGLTLREAADVLGVAPRTADAHWAYARAWLLTAIDGPAD